MSARQPPTSTAPRLGVGYTRYSTEEQGSTAEQRAINEMIAADHGITVLETFTDEGVSRTLADRPGLQELFDHLESHREVRFLVVNELERITAGVGQRQKITSLCKRLGITLVTEDVGLIDPRDEDAMYDADVRAVNAKGEVLKVRRRTRRNLRAKVVAGSTVAMRPPYGVRMKPLVVEGVELPSGMPAFVNGRKIRSGVPELHPEEYPWLVQLFAWADEGLAVEEIARRLTREGVPTKTGKDAWPPNSIAGILDNPFYKGELTWGRQQVLRDENGKPYLEQRTDDDPGRVTRESPLGAIIDPELWDRVNARRLAARGQRNRRKKSTPDNVLDGIVFCGRCGHRMYTRIDNPQSYKTVRIRFYCPGRRSGMVPRQGYGLCEKVNTILADNIIKGIASQPIRGGKTVEVQVTRGVAADAEAEKKRDRLLTRVREAEVEWTNAKRLAVKGLLDDDDLATVKTETASIIAEARSTLEELEQAGSVEVVPFTGTVADRFAELVDGVSDDEVPIELRKTLLRDFGITRIYVDNPSIRVELL
ncbi:recombinase family protein [Nocardioides humi]|uniref:recombinase family protein n=1 Tax=Nocardioides humi TaxID=449461 RepID=UPI0031D4CC4C